MPRWALCWHAASFWFGINLLSAPKVHLPVIGSFYMLVTSCYSTQEWNKTPSRFRKLMMNSCCVTTQHPIKRHGVTSDWEFPFQRFKFQHMFEKPQVMALLGLEAYKKIAVHESCCDTAAFRSPPNIYITDFRRHFFVAALVIVDVVVASATVFLP